MPVLHGRITIRTYSDILARMDSKLSGWKEKSLSLAGRVTLAQSVLAAIPAYAMQTSLLPIDTCKEIDKRIRNFVWGSSPEGRKVHLINWETICAPKDKGGFGLKQARYLNLAYMVKLAFVCFQSPELLWVRVLQGKYLRMSSEGLVPAHRASQSNIWKGICRVWPSMMAGARAGVRNGRSTSLCSSRWLDSGVVHVDFANDLDPDFNLQDCVADFVTGDEGWDLSKLNRLLPAEVVDQVVGRSAPREELGEDNWVWGDAHDGKFSIKSTYELLIGQDLQESSFRWEKLWKWRGPQSIKCFLWLSIHERLLTNGERVRRHMTGLSNCPRCDNAFESVCHVLRDCPMAVNTWNYLGFPTYSAAWRGPVKEWIDWGLHGDLGLLFGVTAWLLWKARNELIFSNKGSDHCQLAVRCCNWARSVSDAFNRDLRCLNTQ
ncbi:Putative ribonuclease H protein At1g65750 [Linum perenne]